MIGLLFIQILSGKGNSGSIAVARAFLDALRKKASGLVVDQIDLWDGDLPRFDGDGAPATGI